MVGGQFLPYSQTQKIFKVDDSTSLIVFSLSSFFQLSILSELSHCHSNEKTGPLIPAQGTENFQLKLSPPPLLEE